MVGVWVGRVLGGWVWWLVDAEWGGVWQSVTHSAPKLPQSVAVAFQLSIQIGLNFISIAVCIASRSDLLNLWLLKQAPNAFLSRWILSVTYLSTLEQATWASSKIGSKANIFGNRLCSTFRGSSQNALRKESWTFSISAKLVDTSRACKHAAVTLPPL